MVVDRLTISFWPPVAAALQLRAWSALSMPLLRGTVMLCMAMSVMVLAQMVFLGTVSAAVKMRRGTTAGHSAMRQRAWRLRDLLPHGARPDPDEQ